MGSRNRVDPLVAKPFEYPEVYNYTVDHGAYYPHRAERVTAKPSPRAIEVQHRDWRIKRYRDTGEKSFLHGLTVQLLPRMIGPRELPSKRKQRLATRIK